MHLSLSKSQAAGFSFLQSNMEASASWIIIAWLWKRCAQFLIYHSWSAWWVLILFWFLCLCYCVFLFWEWIPSLYEQKDKSLSFVPYELVDCAADPRALFCDCCLLEYQVLTLSCFLLWLTKSFYLQPKLLYFPRLFSCKQKIGSGNISIINLISYIV